VTLLSLAVRPRLHLSRSGLSSHRGQTRGLGMCGRVFPSTDVNGPEDTQPHFRERVLTGASTFRPLTSPFGADYGIRTRFPHLGKVRETVLLVCPSLVSCVSVHPVSSTSTRSVAVVERSTIESLGASPTWATCRESNQRGEAPSGTRWDAFASSNVRRPSDGASETQMAMLQQLGMFG
jgi:hypothetical protein